MVIPKHEQGTQEVVIVIQKYSRCLTYSALHVPSYLKALQLFKVIHFVRF